MKLQKKLHILITASTLALVPVVAFAQQAPIDIAGILSRIANQVLAPIAVGLIIIVFIWAGIKYLFTKGDPAKIQEANKMVIWALVGIGVMMLAWAAQNFVSFILFGGGGGGGGGLIF